ncbi:MAG: hypothetical protein AABX16_04630 [Nanoarchaeota archaeon]
MSLKKGGIYLLVFLIIFSVILNVYAQEQNKVDKAYACFEQSLGNNCADTKSTKQNAFNLMAAAYKSELQSTCKSALKQKLKDNCWGETDTSNCNVKSTALATIALDYVGDKTDNYKNYLLSKHITAAGLTWYLEIDANNKTDCDINGKKITLDENKKIIGTPPAGLAKAYNDYWFEIKDTAKNYSVTCDKSFLTALIYQKPNENTFHISSDTKSASEFDTVTEKVNSYCFSAGTTCDYEATLWAALALARTGEEITAYLPYLSAMADKTENKKYLPPSFLYILTNADDYYSQLIALQKNSNYWDESKDKLYDTALALFALNKVGTDEIDRAKNYLLSIQQENGCWQTETAFILHAAWPKNPTGGTGSGSSLSQCEDFDHYCLSIGQCNFADALNNFYCPSSSQVCCSKDFKEQTCLQKGGIICNQDEQCIGDNAPAADTGQCCIGSCIVVDTEPECETQGYICKSQCDKNTEEEKVTLSNSCTFGDVCCAKIPIEQSSYLLWILLIILIILTLLAIFFRNQLKIWFFKLKSGYKTNKFEKPFPPVGGAVMSRPPLFQRPLPFQQRPQPAARPRPEKDKEFEETMRKLKEMSK